MYDRAAKLALEMSFIHDSFIRCLNSIHFNATRIKSEDEDAFVGYCLNFPYVVHDHHDLEESLLFPCFQQKLDMSSNVSQHQLLHEGMDSFQAYLQGMKENKESYDGAKVLKALDSFAGILVTHLNDEVSVPSPRCQSRLIFSILDPNSDPRSFGASGSDRVFTNVHRYYGIFRLVQVIG